MLVSVRVWTYYATFVCYFYETKVVWVKDQSLFEVALQVDNSIHRIRSDAMGAETMSIELMQQYYLLSLQFLLICTTLLWWLEVNQKKEKVLLSAY